MHSKAFFDSISQFRTCGWKVLLFRKLNWDEAKVLMWALHFRISDKNRITFQTLWEFYFTNPRKPDFVSDDWWIFIFFWSFHRYPASTSLFTLAEVVSFIFTDLLLQFGFPTVFSSLSPSLPLLFPSHFHSGGMYWNLLRRAVYTASIIQKLKFCYNVF